jgi:hypothetical protein
MLENKSLSPNGLLFVRGDALGAHLPRPCLPRPRSGPGPVGRVRRPKVTYGGTNIA